MLELRRRERLKTERLVDFIPRISPRYSPPHHLAKLLDVLERSEREPIRAIVSVPPRHAKTETILHAIAYRLQRRPHETIAYVTYGDRLSKGKSRLARAYAERSGMVLMDDATALNEWRNADMGGCLFTSIGGPITGQGANLLIIDDPHKDRAEAESSLHREAVWEWYQGTGYTRVEPGGSIVICHCMVGETPVLMADGYERALRDVRVGDSIATYDDGALSTSRVLNWANQGPDVVFAITTESGTVVRANERHPFLVQRGDSQEWVKLRDLRIDDEIVRATCPTARGEASRAPSKDADSPPSARGSADLTIARRGLTPATSAPPTPCPTEGGRTSGIATVSNSLNTTPFCSSKAASARSASSLPGTLTFLQSGTADSPSTTTTSPAKSAGSSATTAISQSGTERPKTPSSAPLGTYAITCDRIVSIVEDGTEDVFDIQVKATENFIANGLVSHNTRWHPEDLIGRILLEHQHEGFEPITLPAIGDDGAALWPERWSLEALEQRRRVIGEYDWASQFQGRPVPKGGSVFKDVRWYNPRKLPARMRISIGIDLAYSGKTKSDYSACVVLGEDAEKNVYVLSVARAQCEVPAFVPAIRVQAQNYPGARIRWHTSTTETGVAQLLQSLGLPVISELARADKFVRSQAVAARWNNGQVLLPGGFDDHGLPVSKPEWVNDFVREVSTFTGQGDKHDDMVDAMTSAFSPWVLPPMVVYRDFSALPPR